MLIKGAEDCLCAWLPWILCWFAIGVFGRTVNCSKDWEPCHFFIIESRVGQTGYTSYVFKLFSFCLGHVIPILPVVSLGSPDKNSAGVFLLISLNLSRIFCWVAAQKKTFLRVLNQFLHLSSFFNKIGDMASHSNGGIWVSCFWPELGSWI